MHNAVLTGCSQHPDDVSSPDGEAKGESGRQTSKMNGDGVFSVAIGGPANEEKLGWDNKDRITNEENTLA